MARVDMGSELSPHVLLEVTRCVMMGETGAFSTKQRASGGLCILSSGTRLGRDLREINIRHFVGSKIIW